MKAIMFSAVLSCLVITLPVQAFAGDSKIQQTIVKINLNKATVEQLTGSFKGIGKKRAEAIVKYRDEHGNFKTIEDLSQVRGLGKKFVATHLQELQGVFQAG